MNTPIVLDDDALLKLNTIGKLRKLLQREGRIKQSIAHQRVGLGLTHADFEVCVSVLVHFGYCTTERGKLGGVSLVINPDWVNARAAQCPPITEGLLKQV